MLFDNRDRGNELRKNALTRDHNILPYSFLDLGTPLDYSPSLWLDNSDPNALILNDNKVVSYLDKSEALAETNPQTYTVLNNVNCASLTDNGGGSYSVVTGGTFGVNDPRSLNILGVVYAVKFTISNLVGSGDISVSFARNNTTYDVSRTSIATIPLSNGSHTVYVVVTTQDDSQYVKFQDLTGLDFDISNVITSEIQGSHFTQVTPANRPVVDSATVPSQIDFTAANSEYLENTLDVSTFAAMSQGSVVWIQGTLGITNECFTFQDNSVNANYFRVGVISSNFVRVTLSKSGGVVNTWFSTSTVSLNDVIEVGSSGSSYFLKINGITDIVNISAGDDDGKFMNYPSTMDIMSVGSIQTATPIYRDTTFKHLMIRSTPLSDAESLTYANYLIQRYSL